MDLLAFAAFASEEPAIGALCLSSSTKLSISFVSPAIQIIFNNYSIEYKVNHTQMKRKPNLFLYYARELK